MIEAWILVCLGLMVLPGPDMALVTRYASRGQGWQALGGIYLAFGLYSVLLLCGVLVLLEKWPGWVDVAQIGGGLYLLYLSISGLRSLHSSTKEEEFSDNTSPLVAGFWSNLLNAKQYLFLFLLLPGFLPEEPRWTDTLLLLGILLVVSLLFWFVWIWGVSQIASRWNSLYIETASLLALGIVGVLLLFGVL